MLRNDIFGCLYHSCHSGTKKLKSPFNSFLFTFLFISGTYNFSFLIGEKWKRNSRRNMGMLVFGGTSYIQHRVMVAECHKIG